MGVLQRKRPSRALLRSQCESTSTLRGGSLDITVIPARSKSGKRWPATLSLHHELSCLEGDSMVPSELLKNLGGLTLAGSDDIWGAARAATCSSGSFLARAPLQSSTPRCSTPQLTVRLDP